jgi:hypothetical protein
MRKSSRTSEMKSMPETKNERRALTPLEIDCAIATVKFDIAYYKWFGDAISMQRVDEYRNVERVIKALAGRD